MADATKERPTKQYGEKLLLRSLKAKASTVYLAGTLVCKDTAGRATKGAAATTLLCWGRVAKTVDNSAGLDDALDVPIEEGIFGWNNSAAGDAITVADLGKPAYIVDNQTVAKTDGTGARSICGEIVHIEDGQVFCWTGRVHSTAT